MKFTRNSGLVKTWLSLVLAGVYKIDEVPALFNLKAIVTEIYNELI